MANVYTFSDSVLSGHLAIYNNGKLEGLLGRGIFLDEDVNYVQITKGKRTWNIKPSEVSGCTTVSDVMDEVIDNMPAEEGGGGVVDLTPYIKHDGSRDFTGPQRWDSGGANTATMTEVELTFDEAPGQSILNAYQFFVTDGITDILLSPNSFSGIQVVSGSASSTLTSSGFSFSDIGVSTSAGNSGFTAISGSYQLNSNATGVYSTDGAGNFFSLDIAGTYGLSITNPTGNSLLTATTLGLLDDSGQTLIDTISITTAQVNTGKIEELEDATGIVIATSLGDITLKPLPNWALPTGALSRAAFDESTVTLPQLAQRVAALLTDLYSTTRLIIT